MNSAFILAATITASASLALLGGCSDDGGSNGGTTTTSAAGHGGSGGQGNAGGQAGAGGDSIAGDLDLAIRAVAFWPFGPQADFLVRVENADGAFLEGQTGQDGVAHILVDPARGPFDVTLAMAGRGAVSRLGVSGPVGDMSVSGPSDVQLVAVSGDILNAQPTGTRLFIDGVGLLADGVTAYAANYPASAAGEPTALRVTEIDLAQNLVVNGIETPITVPNADMTVDVTLPTPAATIQSVDASIQLPSEGVAFTGAQGWTTIPAAGLPGLAGNNSGLNGFAAWIDVAGMANLTLPPTAGVVPVHAQTFLSDLGAARALVQLRPADVGGLTVAPPLADGTTVTVPPIFAVALAGSGADDLQFSADASGYDTLVVTLTDAAAQIQMWQVDAPGPGWASRGMPHLPSGLTVTDLANPPVAPASAFISLLWADGYAVFQVMLH